MNGRLKSKLLKLLWIQSVIISQWIPAPELSRHPVRIRYSCPYWASLCHIRLSAFRCLCPLNSVWISSLTLTFISDDNYNSDLMMSTTFLQHFRTTKDYLMAIIFLFQFKIKKINFTKTVTRNRDSWTTTVITSPHFSISVLFNTGIKKKDTRQIKKHVAIQWCDLSW